MFIKVMKTLHKIQNIQNIFCNFGNKNSASWSWLLTNQLNSGLLLSHILFLKDCLLILNVENMLKNGKNLHVDFFFFSCVGTKAPPAAKMPWGYLSVKVLWYKVKIVIWNIYKSRIVYVLNINLLSCLSMVQISFNCFSWKVTF